MSEEKPDPILRRKAALVRQAQDAKSMTPGKTLSLALVQAIDQIFGMPVTVKDLVHQLQTAEDLVSGLVNSHLLLLIDGPDSCRGLVALDPQGLAAFIEMLTIGQVSDRPAEPREPTQTDAALVAPMVDFYWLICRGLSSLQWKIGGFAILNIMSALRTIWIWGLLCQLSIFRSLRSNWI